MILWRWYCSLFKPPSEAKRQRWQKVKAGGKKKFILRVGVLKWGGFMFVVMTALDLLRKSPFPRGVSDYAFDVAMNLLVWPLAGYCFGLVMWRFYESSFSNAGSQQPTNRT
jgi:hypothetical protein